MLTVDCGGSGTFTGGTDTTGGFGDTEGIEGAGAFSSTFA